MDPAIYLSRRGVIAGGLVAAATPLLVAKSIQVISGAVGGSAPAAAASAAAGTWSGGLVAARRAGDLANFWAVCTHFTFDQYASRRDEVVQLIADAGIRVVRDGWGPDFPGAAATSDALTSRAIRLAATNSPGDTGGVETEAAVRAMVKAHAARIGDGLIAAEGWNEPGGWAYVLGDHGLKDRVRRWQQWVFAAYRETAPYEAIPVGGPSLADSNSIVKWRALDLAQYADRATVHDYLGDQYVLRDTDFDRFRANGRAMVGRDRIASTETGTTVGRRNAPFAVPDADAAGILVPRVQWEHFRRGWELSATYEFLDEGTDDDYESRFGLVDYHLAPKPAYLTIKNTLNLLLDTAESFVPAPLALTVEGAGEAVHSVLLQKQDGSYWLALWQDVQVWSGIFGRLPSEAQTVTLRFDRTREVTTFDPQESQDPRTVSEGTNATVTVTEGTTLVKIV